MSSQCRAAVLGKPIAHSLSPVLHRAAYRALGLTNWRYAAYECDESELPTILDSLDEQWAGLSLTMPLKRVAIQLATQVSKQADVIGAANTLVIRNGQRIAYNTDVLGMIDALRAVGITQAARPIVLGAGGTAQAALGALATMTQEPVRLMVRNPLRAAQAQATAERLGISLQVCNFSDVATELPQADVVISTLPAGVADFLAATPWRSEAVVFDVLYSPWPTALAQGAFDRGVTVISGLELLLHQAAHQVELITDQQAPIAAMRAALAASGRLLKR